MLKMDSEYCIFKHWDAYNDTDHRIIKITQNMLYNTTFFDEYCSAFSIMWNIKSIFLDELPIIS